MLSWSGKSLNIGGLTAKLPIIQGGMGIGVSLSGLASAVAMKEVLELSLLLSLG